jgi:hypothetical protein
VEARKHGSSSAEHARLHGGLRVEMRIIHGGWGWPAQGKETSTPGACADPSAAANADPNEAVMARAAAQGGAEKRQVPEWSGVQTRYGRQGGCGHEAAAVSGGGSRAAGLEGGRLRQVRRGVPV